MHRAKVERNIIHTMKRKKVNWMGHISRGNCLLEDVTEEKIQGRSNGETRTKG